MAVDINTLLLPCLPQGILNAGTDMVIILRINFPTKAMDMVLHMVPGAVMDMEDRQSTRETSATLLALT